MALQAVCRQNLKVTRLLFSRGFGVSSAKLNAATKEPQPVDGPQQHVEKLSKYYSPEIVEAIKAAESSIDPKTWSERKPSTKFAVPYYDDLTKLDGFWDHQDITDFTKPYQQLAEPDVPEGAFVKSENQRSDSEMYENLSKLTGLDKQAISKLKARTLIVKLVSNQTSKGKIASFYAMVVAGNGNGMVGLGEGKDRQSPTNAMRKAHWSALRNLKFIPRYDERTILEDIDYRYHGVKLFFRSAPPGFGLRVNHYIHEICECAGIKDLACKVYKSRNGMNIAKGTIEALTKVRSLEEVSMARGKKIVDLRKTYYSFS